MRRYIKTVNPVLIREEALSQVEYGRTWSEIAIAAGYEWGGRADTTALKRRLGIMPNNRPKRTYSDRMHYNVAVRIVRALGYDPVDFKL
jgi:hypothetical protein